MAKILIVDDSKTSRKILRSILEECGHEVIAEAVNGEDGIAKYKEYQPDITTLDITMPVLDGIETLKQITDYNPKAVVVMATAAGQKSKIIDAAKSGAADFIQKPFDKDQISTIINSLAK